MLTGPPVAFHSFQNEFLKGTLDQSLSLLAIRKGMPETTSEIDDQYHGCHLAQKEAIFHKSAPLI